MRNIHVSRKISGEDALTSQPARRIPTSDISFVSKVVIFLGSLASRAFVVYL